MGAFSPQIPNTSISINASLVAVMFLTTLFLIIIQCITKPNLQLSIVNQTFQRLQSYAIDQ